MALGFVPGFKPNDLAKRLAEGSCILFAGSGLSAGAGFPTWKRFAGMLLERFGSGKELEYLRESLKQGDADSVVYNVVREVGQRTVLIDYIRELFGRRIGPTDSHRILRKMGFRAALTSNWDSLLEATFPEAQVLTPRSAEELQSRTLKREFFILKAYGDAARPESLLLSAHDFEKEVAANRAFLSFMHGILLQQSLVFVGCSLDGIENFLRNIQFLPSQGSPPHFAITGVGEGSWRSRAVLLEDKYNIRTVTYEESRPEGMVELLRAIEREILLPLHELGVVGERNSRLRRAVLENIGPFDRLELEFDSGWNIFLGNNGVGKSTVLKALAVALCGADAAPWADRLIRGEATSATILLQTDTGQTYRTTISRGLGSSPVVESIPARPMEAEGWLTLGFPPLRTGSWNTPQQGTASSSVPMSDDVLPLVRGEADPRLDRLKSWIVDLDYQIKAELMIEGAPTWARNFDLEHSPKPGLEQLLASFFSIVGKLTDEVKIKFLGVDPKAKRIMVDAGDGPVPLESISQGMASLISWVGVVLQRLHEVYGGPEPAKHHALVLMDEIDAHMHPAWQQVLVPRLREIFPNLQVIATTHSPLIVAGRSREEIFVFERDKSTGRVAVERPRMDFKGLRADQILTSVAFGLDGASDDEGVRKQRRYAELLSLVSPNAAELEELNALRADPAIGQRAVKETVTGHRAAKLLDEVLSHRIAQESPEDTRKLAAETELQLARVKRDLGL